MSYLIHKKEAFSESYEVVLPPCVAWSTADRDQGVASFISLASLASLVSLASLASLASLDSLCSATPSLHVEWRYLHNFWSLEIGMFDVYCRIKMGNPNSDDSIFVY